MIASCASPAIWAKTPIIRRKNQAFEANATAGTSRCAPERRVRLLVLDRVADLVRGDRDRGDRVALVDAMREVDRALPRVVVVRERAAWRRVDGTPARPLWSRIIRATCSPAMPFATGTCICARDGLLQPMLDHEADDQRRDQEDEVDAEVSHVADSYQPTTIEPMNLAPLKARFEALVCRRCRRRARFVSRSWNARSRSPRSCSWPSSRSASSSAQPCPAPTTSATASSTASASPGPAPRRPAPCSRPTGEIQGAVSMLGRRDPALLRLQLRQRPPAGLSRYLAAARPAVRSGRPPRHLGPDASSCSQPSLSPLRDFTDRNDLPISGLTVAFVFGAALWIWTPYLLLGRRLPWRRLLPTGLLTAGRSRPHTRSARQIFLPEIFTTNAERYGLIGIAFGIVSWLFGYAAVVVAAAVVAGTWDRRHPAARLIRPLAGEARHDAEA